MNIFAILLTVLFIGLKLAGYIAWSWLWVLSPIWISFVFFVFLMILILAFDKPKKQKFTRRF